jgi:hypothetical protein
MFFSWPPDPTCHFTFAGTHWLVPEGLAHCKAGPGCTGVCGLWTARFVSPLALSMAKRMTTFTYREPFPEVLFLLFHLVLVFLVLGFELRASSLLGSTPPLESFCQLP